MRASWNEAKSLRRPLLDDALAIIMRTADREDQAAAKIVSAYRNENQRIK
jgi:hypothetical protein